MAERKAVTKAMTKRYAEASEKEKTRMLDELCGLTGWTRRHARRALYQQLQPATPARVRSPRPRVYGPEVIEALTIIWATLNGPTGKRLAPFMAEMLDAMDRCGELQLDPRVRTAKVPDRDLPAKDRAGLGAGASLHLQP